MAAVISGKPDRRALAKKRRQQQLIDATIKCISRKGMGNFTLAHVAKEAGLSQGIVNLHFNSKDNLLSETLLYLVEEYYSAYMQALDRAGADSASKLLALMEMDMSPSICDRTKLAVWFAFWGEVRAVPTYQKLCAHHDARYDEIMVQLCEDIIRDGDYTGVDAQTVTDALSSLTDGLWLSCLVNPKTFNRHDGLKAIHSYLQAVFPKHYQE